MYQKIRMVINIKWIYKTKKDVDGNVQNHKERMVARDFSQHRRIDFNETFAPVTPMDTIRTVMSISTQKNGLFIKWMLN